MSFFKDIFFTRQEPINADKIRTQAWGFLLFGVLFFILFFGDVVWDDNAILLNVSTTKFDQVSKNDVETDFGFLSLRENLLFFKPKSNMDRIIFGSIGSINIADVIFFLLTGIILFKALRNVDDNSSFRKKISNAYKWVGKGCIYMFVIKMAYEGIILHRYFRYVTDNQFALSYHSTSTAYFLYAFLGGIILSLVYFMNKGEALQQDSDLTI